MQREKWGLLSGWIGIGVNIALFVFKMIYAQISGSVSLQADALNNLMDILSSLVIVVGFKVASQKADREHPFGHGRMEQIAGLIISIIIIFTGLELAKSSIERILHPEALQSSIALYVMLIVAILAKFGNSAFNFILGKKIDSNTLVVNAKDSASDVIATFAVLISLICNDIWNLQIDGVAGLVVSSMILYAGGQAAMETINPLLGEALSNEEVAEIGHFVMEDENILSVHDIALHSYGERKKMLTLHVEMDGDLSLRQVHNCIDTMERRIVEKFSYKTMIHVDPQIKDFTETQLALRTLLEQILQSTGEKLHYTDFHCAEDGSYLYCDIYAPYECKQSGKNLRKQIETDLRNAWGKEIELEFAVNRY